MKRIMFLAVLAGSLNLSVLPNPAAGGPIEDAIELAGEIAASAVRRVAAIDYCLRRYVIVTQTCEPSFTCSWCVCRMGTPGCPNGSQVYVTFTKDPNTNTPPCAYKFSWAGAFVC